MVTPHTHVWQGRQHLKFNTILRMQITHADESCGSKAFIRVCMCVCVRTI